MFSIPKSSQESTVSKRIDRAFSGEMGLPNILREKLLQRGLGEAALVLDAMIYAQLIPGAKYGFRKIVDALRRVGVESGEGLIRRGLSAPFFMKSKKSSKRGRPVIIYQMPYIDPLVAHFCGDERWKSTDVLGAADFASLKAYRQALHREFIRRAPGNYSRQFLAGRLGVSARSTRNYDRVVGVVAEVRFKRERVNYYFQRRAPDMVMGREYLEVVTWENGQTRRMPAKPGVFYRYRDRAEIFLVTQLANHYSLSTAI